MKKVNAVQLRQSLSKIIAMLKKTGQPILLHKASKPVAVIISLEDFQRRFADKEADDLRAQLVDEIKSMAVNSSDSISADDALHELRYGGSDR